jgi:hypothetical protein
MRAPLNSRWQIHVSAIEKWLRFDKKTETGGPLAYPDLSGTEMTLRRPQRRETQRLRRVVDCLPYETRVAMLDGLRQYDRIIVGAYTDRTGGVCPMLAAHRCGGRTDFRSFARAWDRFTGAGKRARKATEREVRTLVTQLEASIWTEDERRAQTLRPGETMPVQPRRRWLGPFRRWDGYRDAVRGALGEDVTPDRDRRQETAGV